MSLNRSPAEGSSGFLSGSAGGTGVELARGEVRCSGGKEPTVLDRLGGSSPCQYGNKHTAQRKGQRELTSRLYAFLTSSVVQFTGRPLTLRNLQHGATLERHRHLSSQAGRT